MKKEMLVGFVELFQITRVRVDRLAIEIAGPFAQTPHEHVGRGLQVDHEIGRRHVLREQVIKPLIDEQLVVIEIQIREDLVLVEQVITDGGLREQIALLHVQLLMTAQEKEELRLQRRSLRPP